MSIPPTPKGGGTLGTFGWNLAIYLDMASVIMYIALLIVEEQDYIDNWVVN